jgi:hypothetical protein
MTPSNKRPGERRLVQMSADASSSPAPTWAPDLPIVEQYTQTFPFGADAEYVLRYDLDEWNRTVEWAVIQKRRLHGHWQRVAVYDTCHGKGVHVHFYDRDDHEFAQTPLRPIKSHKDLDEGLQDALRWVCDSWRENERRSDRGY